MNYNLWSFYLKSQFSVNKIVQFKILAKLDFGLTIYCQSQVTFSKNNVLTFKDTNYKTKYDKYPFKNLT